jgi:hypothetical protein
MNSGTLLYQGHRVIFTQEIIFQGKRQFLIAFNSEPMWVMECDVAQICYIIAA